MVLLGFNSPSPTPAKSHCAVPQHRVPVLEKMPPVKLMGSPQDDQSLYHGESVRDKQGKGKADLGKDAGAAQGGDGCERGSYASPLLSNEGYLHGIHPQPLGPCCL